MNASANNPLSILAYWRDLEVFNIPSPPSSRDSSAQTAVQTLRRGDVLPWRDAKFASTDQHGFVHVVYLGVTDAENLCQLLLHSIDPDGVLSERDRARLPGKGWLAAFTVDENGHEQSDSYMAASFAHGVDAWRECGHLDNLNSRLNQAREAFSQRRHRLEDATKADGESQATDAPAPPLDWKDLDAELQVARRLLGEEADDPAIEWRIVVRSSRVPRRLLEDNLQAAADFLNSFFLDDLDRLIEQSRQNRPFGRALTQYLGRALDDVQRVDILEQHKAMAALVSSRHLPSARWPAPSNQPLALAQQAAVAHVLHTLAPADGLIGINGPPGTGKTTLLCDVIAQVVTDRACRIAALSRPSELFEDKIGVAGKSFFPLKSSIMAGSSIVVASSNNNAVKNITQELPALKKIATGEHGATSYFAEVMGEIFKHQKVWDDDDHPVAAWGTIAAALGNAGNRHSFSKGFFRDDFASKPRAGETADENDDSTVATESAGTEPSKRESTDTLPPTMKQLLEAASNDYHTHLAQWNITKRAFLELQEEIVRQRLVLEAAESAAIRLDAHHDELRILQRALSEAHETVRACETTLAQRIEACATQRAVVEAKQAVLLQLSAAVRPTLWDRLLALAGRETARMAAGRSALAAPTQTLADASSLLANLSREVEIATSRQEQALAQHASLTARITSLRAAMNDDTQAMEAGRALGAKHFPNAHFWSLPAAERHRASIAVGEQLDHLRAKLFLQAVELHRLTILVNAGKFIANLRATNGMLTGKLKGTLPIDQVPRLWDAFFFIVPVVSTTLASFDRLFHGMGQNSLGWLLIDEAGQATPQSAAGALWRSRRAVVVGDPLQIEPVFTVPHQLAEDLRRHHGVAQHWSPTEESVQTLADRITTYGSWVGQEKDDSMQQESSSRLWTGMPLRTHRRCDDPMFSVANRIAYAGQMVAGRVDDRGRPAPTPIHCVLGDSAWFDVQSDRVRHPVSDDEIAVLGNCLERLQQTPVMIGSGEEGKRAKIYVISPFRKIADACRQHVRRCGMTGVDCGTVHTFQGKEADIVFLVLGTAPGAPGAGARQWAASKPNLLNVAITRAKSRLYVIGDAQQWGCLDYYRELRTVLPMRRIIDR